MLELRSSALPVPQAGPACISAVDRGTPGYPVVYEHPLGGAVMGDACDDLGQLYGYSNLFVIDGSLLPGSAANANPTLTIAAIAERIMEALVPTLVT